MRSPSHVLRQRILQHLLVGGATLTAGCIVEKGPTREDAAVDGAADVAVDMSPDAAPGYIESLPPMPEHAESDCGYDYCLALEADDTCADRYDESYRVNPGGDNGCCLSELEGPFRAEPHHPELPCCYIFSGVYCEGRPFFVGQDNRLAPAVPRADWC